MKSGVVMGLSEALRKKFTFDKEKVTSTNWSRYKILTMERNAGDQSRPDFTRRQRLWRRLRSGKCSCSTGSRRSPVRRNRGMPHRIR